MAPFVLLLTLYGLCTYCSMAQLSSWTKPSYPRFSYSFGAKVVGYHAATNKIWFIGGYTNSDDVHSFDVSSPSFVPHSSLPYGSEIEAFSQLYATAAGGDIIYMIRDNGNTNYISTFNMNDQTFTSSLTSLSTYTKYHATLAYIAGYLMVVGGTDYYGYPIKDFQILRLSDKTWFNGPNMDEGRDEFASNVNSANYLYIIGGGTASIDKINVANIEQINDGSYSWNNIGTTSNSDSSMRSVIFEDDIFVLGGSSGATVDTVDTVDIIHTLTDTIDKNVNSMALKVRNGAAVLAGNVIYYFGGWCSSCNSLVDSYQFATIPTSSPSNQPSNAPTTTTTTSQPTAPPTQNPSQEPTKSPTYIPTNIPTNVPTNIPTSMPSNVPTINPTTTFPSVSPTNIPSEIPSNAPTDRPTLTDSYDNGQVVDVTTTDNPQLDDLNGVPVSVRSKSMKVMLFTVMGGIICVVLVIVILFILKHRQRPHAHKSDAFPPNETIESTSRTNGIELSPYSANPDIINKMNYFPAAFSNVNGLAVESEGNVVNLEPISYQTPRPPARSNTNEEYIDNEDDDTDILEEIKQTPMDSVSFNNNNNENNNAVIQNHQMQIGDDDFVICGEDEVQYTPYNNTMQ